MKIWLTMTALFASACGTGPKVNPKHDDLLLPYFKNISEKVGLKSTATWKYGGPAIADLNQDGRYDLLLSNHHEVPATLYWGSQSAVYTEHKTPIARWDVHGIAAGDYDLDGDGDILVALGGGNGTTPQPPRLLQNNNGQFDDVTEQAGIADMGARGRAVRWLDLDSDGDLDILQINAEKLENEIDTPRNILFENTGKGRFQYRENETFESINAERVLLAELNGDMALDLITFSPLGLYINEGDFRFNNVSERLPFSKSTPLSYVQAVAAPDIDNDGDADLYIARGKTYYQIANNSLHFNADTHTLDIRDQGNANSNGITFTTNNEQVTLAHFWHWPRGQDVTLPIFVGKEAQRFDTPDAAPLTFHGEQALGEALEKNESGWYLSYLGKKHWRLDWVLKDSLAWDIRASLSGISGFTPDFKVQNLAIPDLLLRNDGDRFTDISYVLPEKTQTNNWGVTHGDFNNDGWEDLFVYRFGNLRERIEDILLLNREGQHFTALPNHGATVTGTTAHGDMGAAFDYDRDGDVDLLSGDDDQGKWYLFENTLGTQAHHAMLVEVGYSPSGTGPEGAKVSLSLESGLTQVKWVASAGATHSQSQLNIVHFGLGAEERINKISVTWRDNSAMNFHPHNFNNPDEQAHVAFFMYPAAP